MKVAIIAVSRDGIRLAKKLTGLFEAVDIYVPPRLIIETGKAEGGKAGPEADLSKGSNESCDAYYKEKPAKEGLNTNTGKAKQVKGITLPAGRRGGDKAFQEQGAVLKPLRLGFYSGVAEIFRTYQALIFISAAAVAVRAVAPCLAGKDSDPAVVAIDERGRFAISLLSGHLGGGNDLTKKIAGFIDAQAVITTATDAKGLTAFDSLARQWDWTVENLPDLKYISAAMLEGREIVVYGRQPRDGVVLYNNPTFENLKDVLTGKLAGNINITEDSAELSRARHGAVVIDNRLEKWPIPENIPQIILRPKNVAAGVGCRKGIPAQKIIKAVERAFKEAGLSLESLNCLASGEFKADERGLIEAARFLGVPFKIFTRSEIAALLRKETLNECSRSAFVEDQVGVGAVAEPCAVLGSGGSGVVLPVIKAGGITVSLAEGPLFTATNI